MARQRPKFPAPRGKYPAGASREFAHKLLNRQRDFPPEFVQRAIFRRIPCRFPSSRECRATEQGDSEFTHEQAVHRRKQAPVMACYDFSKALVWLEIPRNNRRDFFARSPRAGTGSAARKSARRKSPVPKHQVSDFIESFALQNFSRKMQSAGTEAARHGTEIRERPIYFPELRRLGFGGAVSSWLRWPKWIRGRCISCPSFPPGKYRLRDLPLGSQNRERRTGSSRKIR